MSRTRSIYLSIFSMLLFLLLFILTASGVIGFSPVGEEGSFGAPLIIPESYAFSIWAPIYIFLIIFPFYQLFKKREENEFWNRIRMLYSINVIANGLWLVGAAYEWMYTTLALIIIMLLTLVKINTLLVTMKSQGLKINFWLERIGFSIYFGWITLATALNVSAALKFYQWDGFGISELTWSLIILSVAAVIAAVIFWKYRDVGYALVIVWAFIALVVKHLNAKIDIAYLSIGVVVLFTGFILIHGAKKFKGVKIEP